MIEVNLLPGSRKKKASVNQPIDFAALAGGLSGRMKDKFMIAAVAGVVIGLVAGGTLFLTQASKEKELTARQEKAVQDSTRFANFLKERHKAEAVRDTLLRQVNIIRNLDEDRFVWPHVLDEISRALPQYTWITLINYSGSPQGTIPVVVTPKIVEDTSAAAKKKAKLPKRLETEIPKDTINVHISGMTVDIQALTRFMKDLEVSPFLSNVQLDRSELAIDQGKEVTQFQLTMRYSRPDSLILHRVPVQFSAGAGGSGGMH